MKSVAIVGGGIAGLSIAQAIRRRDPAVNVRVFEADARPGGNIRTEVVEGYVCEWGPDGFLDNVPETLALAREVGLGAALRPSSDEARRRFIFRGGRLHEVPLSPKTFLTSSLLSLPGKLRLLAEPFGRSRPEGDETIYEFAARRIGVEAANVMIDSMVSGIFAGNARTLSLRACFPKMWQLETDYRSLVRALIATRRKRRKEDAMGAPAGRLTSFDEGMEQLIAGLVRTLGDSLRTSSRIQALSRNRSVVRDARHPYTLLSDTSTFGADAVVLAGSASASARLLRSTDTTLADLLQAIPTASLAVVCLGFDARALAADRGPLNGFGFLVPRQERIRLLGALWETSIYPRRAPEGKALIRAMIGGALDPDAVRLDDHDLLQLVRADLYKTMGLRVRPEFVRIIRHARGIPQYNVGHLERLTRIENLLRAHPGLFLAGNSYRGVAINSCIAEAGPIADRVLESIASQRVRSPLQLVH